jgi:CHAD domain-containing protein
MSEAPLQGHEVAMQLTLFEPMAKRNSKWIDGLSPEMRVSQAARKTLRRRLKPVWSLLKSAAEKSERSTEYVHQLRVATRRALAAVEGYAELIPVRKVEKMTKRLNQIRKRAGEARDYDVLVERLAARPDVDHLRPLVEAIGRLRREVQSPVREIYRKLRKKDFPRTIRKLIDQVHYVRDEQRATLGGWARMGTERAAAAFFAAAAGNLDDLAELHQFRIAGKNLRYVLEYSAGGLGPEVRNSLYPEIERIQSLLGIVNDHAAALAHFDAWRNEWEDEDLCRLVDEQIVIERTALEDARREFFRWWTPQRAAELRDRLALVVARPDEEHAA